MDIRNTYYRVSNEILKLFFLLKRCFVKANNFLYKLRIVSKSLPTKRKQIGHKL